MLFPAYAGVILGFCGRFDRLSAFPRIRGGDPEWFRDENLDDPLFPAYAGVIPHALAGCTAYMPFPRIRGGDPLPMLPDIRRFRFSPHTRG